MKPMATSPEIKPAECPLKRGQSLQAPFLDALRKERLRVTIYLLNGTRIQGEIDSFDQFAIRLRNSAEQMIYKSAISTVVPVSRLAMTTSGDCNDDE